MLDGMEPMGMALGHVSHQPKLSSMSSSYCVELRRAVPEWRNDEGKGSMF